MIGVLGTLSASLMCRDCAKRKETLDDGGFDFSSSEGGSPRSARSGKSTVGTPISARTEKHVVPKPISYEQKEVDET